MGRRCEGTKVVGSRGCAAFSTPTAFSAVLLKSQRSFPADHQVKIAIHATTTKGILTVND